MSQRRSRRRSRPAASNRTSTWLKEAWGDAADNFIVRGTPYNTGTPLRLMLDAGAQPIGDPRACHAIAVDARAPKFDGGIVTRLDCIPLGIVVNQLGERFATRARTCGRSATRAGARSSRGSPEQSRIAWSTRRCASLFMPSVFPPIVGRHDSRARRATRSAGGSRRARRSRDSTMPCGPARSTTRCWTTAARRAWRQRRVTGRSGSTRRRSGAIPCGRHHVHLSRAAG